MPTEKRKKPIRPTRLQCHAIGEWLKDNKDRLLAARPTLEETARQAAEGLKFAVSPSTLATEMRLLGISWVAKRGPGRIDNHELIRSVAVFCRDAAKKLDMELPGKLKEFFAQEAERKKKYPKTKEDES